MMKRSWIVPLTALLLFAALSGADVKTVQQDESGNPWPNAVEMTTEHFILRTDLPEKDRQAMTDGLEELYKVFSQLFGQIKCNEKFLVYLFAAEATYKASIAKNHPDAVKNPAFGFYSAKERISHFKFRGEIPSTIEALRHECGHQLFDADIRKGRVVTGKPFFWVHEGISCYLETMEKRGDRYIFGNTGHYLYKTMIEKGKDFAVALDIAKFSDLAQQEYLKGGTKNYIFAATLVHFFFHGTTKEEAAKFKKFILEVENANGSQKTFQEVMGKPINEYQQKWVDYIKDLSAESWEESLKSIDWM